MPNSTGSSTVRRQFVLIYRRLLPVFLVCLVVGVLWLSSPQRTGQAQETPKYIGPEACATCHADVYKTWALTAHRATLYNKEPKLMGCEACHGPGGEHVAAGGDKAKITRLAKLKPEEASAVCQKCHTEEGVTLWHTSSHARAKVSCITCHDPHSPGEKTLLRDLEDARTSVEGLTRSIKQAKLAANIAAPGSKEKADADGETKRLEAERNKLAETVKGAETAYQKTAEPYVCYSCHKAQMVRSKMPSHHPLLEGKMKCSSCHNPHGGITRMLNGESVLETCAKCHAEKAGPFTFEHPPVTESCTICHNPHGSTQDNLLVQSQPFVCLKCHAGPHSRRGALGSPVSTSQYYSRCTNCHNQVHGSDSRQSFRW